MRREARLVVVTTGYIAGFPGKAELEFEATERTIESELFDFAHIFPFSEVEPQSRRHAWALAGNRRALVRTQNSTPLFTGS
jgi:tRNA A37 methylthiotransferase MiaB